MSLNSFNFHEFSFVFLLFFLFLIFSVSGDCGECCSDEKKCSTVFASSPSAICCRSSGNLGGFCCPSNFVCGASMCESAPSNGVGPFIVSFLIVFISVFIGLCLFLFIFLFFRYRFKRNLADENFENFGAPFRGHEGRKNSVEISETSINNYFNIQVNTIIYGNGNEIEMHMDEQNELSEGRIQISEANRRDEENENENELSKIPGTVNLEESTKTNEEEI